MKFTEEEAAWLRAALDGKTVQWRSKANEGIWYDATDFSKDATLLTMDKCEVRIKPDVIIVNGIEVPAPEKVEPGKGAKFWLADATEKNGFNGHLYWEGSRQDKDWLQLEVLHLSPEAAGDHGKAMRAHKTGW